MYLTKISKSFNKHACLKQTNKKSQQISRQSQQKKITLKVQKANRNLRIKQHNYIFRSTSLVDPRINYYLKESQDRIANWWVSAQAVIIKPVDGSPSQLLAHSFWCRYEAVILKGISLQTIRTFLFPLLPNSHYYRGHRWFGITGCKWELLRLVSIFLRQHIHYLDKSPFQIFSRSPWTWQNSMDPGFPQDWFY